MKNKVKIVTALLITALCTTSAYAAENLIKNDIILQNANQFLNNDWLG